MLYPTELRAHSFKPTSNKYYARVRVKGKLIVKSLKTATISVAKLRLANFEKAERACAEKTSVAALRSVRKVRRGNRGIKKGFFQAVRELGSVPGFRRLQNQRGEKRDLAVEASALHDVPVDRISFKGTVDASRLFSLAIAQARSQKKQRQFVAELLRVIAVDQVPDRPGRRQPRAVKRRPKPYPLLHRPRHPFKEIPHRSRYRKAA